MLVCSWGMDVSIPKEEYEVKQGGEVLLSCSFSPANPSFSVLVLSWKAFPDNDNDPMVRAQGIFIEKG